MAGTSGTIAACVRRPAHAKKKLGTGRFYLNLRMKILSGIFVTGISKSL
jgi:hypothetical protein